jgi:hypothetical protein
MLPVIAVRPAIKAALADRGQIVGDEIVAELVALVDYGPEDVAAGVEGEAVGIAQAAGEDAGRARLGVDLQDRGPRGDRDDRGPRGDRGDRGPRREREGGERPSEEGGREPEFSPAFLTGDNEE